MSKSPFPDFFQRGLNAWHSEGLRGLKRLLQGVLEGLGAPVVPFYPFSFWVPLLKPNSRKKGTLIMKGLLGNLEA